MRDAKEVQWGRSSEQQLRLGTWIGREAMEDFVGEDTIKHGKRWEWGVKAYLKGEGLARIKKTTQARRMGSLPSMAGTRDGRGNMQRYTGVNDVTAEGGE